MRGSRNGPISGSTSASGCLITCRKNTPASCSTGATTRPSGSSITPSQRSQLSSCYLLDSPLDDLIAIYDKYSDVAKLSKYAGEIVSFLTFATDRLPYPFDEQGAVEAEPTSPLEPAPPVPATPMGEGESVG